MTVRSGELPGVPEMILLLARQEMERAAALCRGQFLEEHLSEDWSVAMRERCRLRFVDLSRHLARL